VSSKQDLAKDVEKIIRKRSRKRSILLGLGLVAVSLLLLSAVVLYAHSTATKEVQDRVTIQQVLHQEASCPVKGFKAAKCSALLLREVESLTPSERSSIAKLFG
jgi:hypothetical protein